MSLEELFDLHDKNRLFYAAEAMHDEFITEIKVVENEIRIVYGEIGESGYRSPYRKVTVSYGLDNIESDLALYIFKPTRRGKKEERSINELAKLNQWNMIMYKYDIDMWGEMTLHFNINKGKKHRNAELSFTPAWIRYLWEE